MPSEVPDGWQLGGINDLFTRLRVPRTHDRDSRAANGSAPILDQSENGWFGAHEGAPDLRASHDEPLITFANHTCAVRFHVESFSVIQNVFPLRAREDVWPKYLYSVLSGAVPQDGYRGHWPEVKRLRLLLPPLPEQKKIAAILSSVDEAIQATQAVIEQTRRVKEGLLQDLLTRGIGHTRFKQTEIGEIPESWDVRELGTQLKEVSYGTSEPAKGTQADVPVLRIPNVSGGRIDLTHLKYIAVADHLVERFLVRAGDILVIRTNGNPDVVGRCALVQDGVPKCLYASYLIKLATDESRVLPEFASTFINSAHARHYLDRERATSAGNYNINATQLKGLPMPIPSLHEQAELVRRFASIRETDSAYRHSLTQLRQVKAGLLQDLLTGKVRVSV